VRVGSRLRGRVQVEQRFTESREIHGLTWRFVLDVAECIEVKKTGFRGSRIQAVGFCWACLVWVLKVRFWTTLKDLLKPR